MTKINFMNRVYFILLIVGCIGLVIALSLAGKIAMASYACGFFLIGFMIWLWDLSLRFVMDEKHQRPKLGFMLIFCRYALLGGFIYAMMALFAVSWIWFIAGFSTLLPTLFICTLFFGEKQRKNPAP